MPGNGTTIMFWKEQWSGIVPTQIFSELYSFVIKPNLSLRKAWEAEDFHTLFHLPLSEQALGQMNQLLENVGTDGATNRNGSMDLYLGKWHISYIESLQGNERTCAC